jgi:hypothetical protein
MDKRKFLMMNSSYVQKIIATGPILYYPLNELSGTESINHGTLGVAANGVLGAAGAAPTLGAAAAPGGGLCPSFDGGDFINFYSVALRNALIGITEGTFAVWYKVANVGVWTDATSRTIYYFNANNTDIISIGKSTTAGRMTFTAEFNNIAEAAISDGHSSTAWQMTAVTWNPAIDTITYYINGVSVATDITVGALFAGALTANLVTIGCYNSTAPSSFWNGNIAHPAIWTKAFSTAEILALYNAGL